MCAHNYDGDVLTDEIAQVHRSPGFLTSVLNGVNDDGSIIKEFEASHGTVTDMYKAHLRGEETSLNPLSMMEALVGAMQHSAVLAKGPADLIPFSKKLQSAIHAQMTTPGKGTRDLSGPSGLTTQQFVSAVKAKLDASLTGSAVSAATAAVQPVDAFQADNAKMREMFDSIDVNRDGQIGFDEFVAGMKKLGIAPRKL
jgi:isocitrate dehydrogenase